MGHALSIVEPVSVDYLMREVRTAGLIVSAGFPSPAGDDLEDSVDRFVDRAPGNLAFWYRVSGNSLCRARKVLPGRTVLALHNGDMALKVLTRRDGRLWLEARSDDHYPPLPVPDTTKIGGVVAGIARRYPVE